MKAEGAYRTITEVAEQLDLPAHVLRFWETKFPQIQPLKRGGGRRYYRPQDVELIHKIRTLLHYQGYTIRGVQKLLDGDDAPARQPAAKTNGSGADEQTRAVLVSVRSELLGLLDELHAAQQPGQPAQSRPPC